MSFIDILILIVAAGSIIFGVSKGVIKQLGSIVGVIAGIVLARLLGGAVGNVYAGMLPDEFAMSAAGQYASGIAGRVTVLVLVYFVVLFLAKSLKFVVHALLLGPVDRALGAVLAMFQWFLGLSVILNVYAAISPGTALSEHSRIAGGMALETIMSLAPALLGGHYAPWIG